MTLFICWVVFVLFLIGSVTVAAVMEKRAQAAAAVVDESVDPNDEYGEAAAEGEEVVEEFQADEAFSEFPAEGGEPVDDFAAFDEEFK